ncbi:MAG TPA: AarF/UbiB family protein [Anaerolineae bacterium]|nr:AarF/UbiB family protein [Anaerolineae bacterium]
MNTATDASDARLWTEGDGKGRAARTAEILLTLARLGFGELIERAWWLRWLPDLRPPAADHEPAEPGAVRLRRMFEALGPSFVKIGQLLSSHAGALPQEYRDELSRLLDSTLPLPFPVIEGVLAAELGEDWRTRFGHLDSQPLASASIGQVHAGTLPDGTRIAVKVQRPGAQAIFDRDFDIVRDLVRHTRLHALLHMTRDQLDAIVGEIIGFTQAEFDYCREAEAARRLGAMDIPGMTAPHAYDDLCTRRVLVTQFLEGVTLNEVLSHLEDPQWLEEHAVDRDRLARQIMRNQIVQALRYGFFQADPHPANLILMPDGRLGYVDFGIVGELDEQARRDIVDMALYEMLDDFEAVWPILVRYGTPTEQTDIRAFRAEFKELSARYKREGTRSFSGRSLGFYIEEQLMLYHRHHLKVATGWATYLRGVIVYGNTAAALSEKLNFMRDNLPIFQEIKARHELSGLTLERAWTEGVLRQGYDLQRSLRALAVLLRRAEEGELTLLSDEGPRSEQVRNARLRVAVWLALLLLAAWLAVTLRDVLLFGRVSWLALGLPGIAACLWGLLASLRRLRT